MYTVPFQLSARPPASWGSLFVEHWNHPPQLTMMHRPGIARVSGNKIFLEGTTVEEVKDYHRDTLKLAADAANQEYRARVAEAERERRILEDESARHQRNVDDVATDITFD